jgi:DNA-binding MarR family transcriptional regulator
VSANDAWESLLRAHATLMKQFAAHDIWAELSLREYDVLYTLSKCQEPTRINDLNRYVLLSQPALSRLVDRLVGRGLIARCGDPADGRSVRLSLTPAGRDIQQRVGRAHARDVASAMTAGLTPSEILELETLCSKLAASQLPVLSLSAPAPAIRPRPGCWPTSSPPASPHWPVNAVPR